MDTAHALVSDHDLVPPAQPRSVYRIGLVGLVLSAIAAAIGLLADAILTDVPAILATLRLGLVGFGVVVAGSAISMRPELPRAWLIAVATGFLAAYVGIPEHWDSGRLLARVFSGVALAGAVLVAVQPTVRYVLMLCGVLFHFSSILISTTWPDPTPWLVNQLGQRIYIPYQQFTYLRNAYHFYSPEPGPASLLFTLVTYEYDTIDPDTGKPKVEQEWITIPHRGTQTKDPLALTYYRRLSITENATRVSPDISWQTEEKRQIRKRRDDVANPFGVLPAGVKRIPHPPVSEIPEFRWYLQPQADITRYLLPSYAKHIAVENSVPGRRVVKVKIYRAEHLIVAAQYFAIQKVSPYHPSLFRIYFLGDYTPDGKLIDPQDPMLYWIIPVTMKPEKHPLNDPRPEHFDDYLTEHSGFVFDWRNLRP